MNTNPRAKVVLCYGDSNTHGTAPAGNRYETNVRWTGQLQQLLGNDFYVIEEGLGGRTTDLDHPREEKPGRDGFEYFRPCVWSHAPLNIVILMLGTNDLKNVYHRTAQEVAEALVQYCNFLQEFDKNIKIIMVAPHPFRATEPVVFYDGASAKKSEELPEEVRRVAKAQGATFFDATELVTLGGDGLHWDKASEELFAKSMGKIVRELV